MPQKREVDDFRLKAKLNDSQQQRGVAWRRTKIEAVAEARKKGYDEKTIFIELKRAGLTNHTSKSIMEDAWYCNSLENKRSLSPKEQADEIAQKLKKGRERKK